MADTNGVAAESAAKLQRATKGNPGFLVTRRGEIQDAQVDEAGRVVGWNPQLHAFFTHNLERAKRLAEHVKGAAR